MKNSKFVKLWCIGLLSLLLVATLVGLGLWLSKQPRQFASDEFKEILAVGSWGRIGDYPFPLGGSYGFAVRFYKDGTYRVSCPDGDVFFSNSGTWTITDDCNNRFRLHLKEMGNPECSMLTFDNQVLYLE